MRPPIVMMVNLPSNHTGEGAKACSIHSRSMKRGVMTESRYLRADVHCNAIALGDQRVIFCTPEGVGRGGCERGSLDVIVHWRHMFDKRGALPQVT